MPDEDLHLADLARSQAHTLGHSPRKGEPPMKRRRAQVANAQPTNRVPTYDQTAQRAYELFLARGGTHGQDIKDWLRAEQELQAAEGSTP